MDGQQARLMPDMFRGDRATESSIQQGAPDLESFRNEASSLKHPNVLLESRPTRHLYGIRRPRALHYIHENSLIKEVGTDVPVVQRRMLKVSFAVFISLECSHRFVQVWCDFHDFELTYS